MSLDFRGKNPQKIFFGLVHGMHYIEVERKRELKMEKMVFYVSDCCGVESDKDYEICSSCGEHCEIVTDDSLERDYIPGYDDGEW